MICIKGLRKEILLSVLDYYRLLKSDMLESFIINNMIEVEDA